jgi:predicted nucleic acid binding AN1-type Zn finger protein
VKWLVNVQLHADSIGQTDTWKEKQEDTQESNFQEKKKKKGFIFGVGSCILTFEESGLVKSGNHCNGTFSLYQLKA